MKWFRLFGVALMAMFALGVTMASSASALPDLSVLPGEPTLLHLDVTDLTVSTKISNPVEVIKGTGLLLLLLSDELTALGTFEILFTNVVEETGERCKTTNDAEGEELLSGTYHIVYTSLSPLTIGTLYLVLPVEITCGTLVIKVEGSMLSSLSPAASGTDQTSVAGVLKGNSEGKPNLVNYYNDGGTIVKAKLTFKVSGGTAKEAAMEVEEAVTVYALQGSEYGKMFYFTY